MEKKRVIGLGLMALPLVALLVATAEIEGWRAALGALGVLVLLGAFFVGLMLAASDWPFWG